MCNKVLSISVVIQEDLYVGDFKEFGRDERSKLDKEQTYLYISSLIQNEMQQRRYCQDLVQQYKNLKTYSLSLGSSLTLVGVSRLSRSSRSLLSFLSFLLFLCLGLLDLLRLRLLFSFLTLRSRSSLSLEYLIRLKDTI